MILVANSSLIANFNPLAYFRFILSAIGPSLFFLLTLSCNSESSSKQGFWVAQGSIMGTQYLVKLMPELTRDTLTLSVIKDPVIKKSLIKDQLAFESLVLRVFNRVNELMSTYLDESEVSQINRADVSVCTSIST